MWQQWWQWRENNENVAVVEVVEGKYYKCGRGGEEQQKRGGGAMGYPGSVIVPQYGSGKITAFVWGNNTIL